MSRSKCEYCGNAMGTYSRRCVNPDCPSHERLGTIMLRALSDLMGVTADALNRSADKASKLVDLLEKEPRKTAEEIAAKSINVRGDQAKEMIAKAMEAGTSSILMKPETGEAYLVHPSGETFLIDETAPGFLQEIVAKLREQHGFAEPPSPEPKKQSVIEPSDGQVTFRAGIRLEITPYGPVIRRYTYGYSGDVPEEKRSEDCPGCKAGKCVIRIDRCFNPHCSDEFHVLHNVWSELS